ncbi:ankyrin repeat domain-containing protein [Actinomadura sp. 6N118]|uniref:ankyrin repeat domain-containing protein n=1 Tax=Actinomadura sp. 6N118 TaxID=3375151 RepID=UPI0037B2E1BE
MTPSLFEALEADDARTVQWHLEQGADPNAVDPRWPPPFAWPPLSVAATRGNAEMVRLLLSYGADVNVRDSGGGTPLIWACNGEHLDCARALLQAGADPTLRNNDGYTAYGRTPMRNQELLNLLRHHGGS